MQQSLLAPTCQVSFHLANVERTKQCVLESVSEWCVSRAAERGAKRPTSAGAPCILRLQWRELDNSTGRCGRDRQSRKHSASYGMKLAIPAFASEGVLTLPSAHNKKTVEKKRCRHYGGKYGAGHEARSRLRTRAACSSVCVGGTWIGTMHAASSR